jgi:hypothetical protein
MFRQIQWNIWKLSKSNINNKSLNSEFKSFGMWQRVTELAVTGAVKKMKCLHLQRLKGPRTPQDEGTTFL